MNTQTFTVYRSTIAFMNTLNDSAQNLDLHRQRSLEGNDLAVQAIKTLLNSHHVIPVALVTCNADNDDLFRLTNSINDFWGNNTEVELLASAEQGFMSSSSVGDIYQDSAGQFFVYQCAGVRHFEH